MKALFAHLLGAVLTVFMGGALHAQTGALQDEGPIFTIASSGNERDDRAWRTYILRCVGCHQMDGSGMPEAGIPNFTTEIGVFGADHEGRSYLMNVPNVAGSGLSAQAIADVMNFIMDYWAGPSLPENWAPFSAEEVSTHWSAAPDDIVSVRREIVRRLAQQGLTAPIYPWP